MGRGLLLLAKATQDMNSDLQRIEDKVDTLTDAVTRLVLFEERQTLQSAAIKTLDLRTLATDKKLDAWINRGIGVWFIVTILASIAGFLFKVHA